MGLQGLANVDSCLVQFWAASLGWPLLVGEVFWATVGSFFERMLAALGKFGSKKRGRESQESASGGKFDGQNGQKQDVGWLLRYTKKHQAPPVVF